MTLSGDWQPTVVIADAYIDPDRFIFEGVDTSRYPTWTVGETAKVFFAKSPSWLRSQERCGRLSIPGEEPIQPKRRVQNNARFFCLEDIEFISHSLAYHGVISGVKLRLTLVMLKAQGQLWGYIA